MCSRTSIAGSTNPRRQKKLMSILNVTTLGGQPFWPISAMSSSASPQCSAVNKPFSTML
uniref:Uncharacterized protein n=1 Tax=Arundo donax TaxID=35708 RepID=A0A0A8YDQ1_ARUDO